MMMKIWAHSEICSSFFWHFEPNVVKLSHPINLFFNRSHFVIALVIRNCRVINHVFESLIVVVYSSFVEKTVTQIINVKVAISPLFNNFSGSNFVFPAAFYSLFVLRFRLRNRRNLILFHFIDRINGQLIQNKLLYWL